MHACNVAVVWYGMVAVAVAVASDNMSANDVCRNYLVEWDLNDPFAPAPPGKRAGVSWSWFGQCRVTLVVRVHVLTAD